MSAVEEIEAAIATLSELRDFGGVRYLETVNETHSWYTTQLAVTLHRTIDAQLAILQGAIEAWRAVEKEGSPDFLVRHVEGYMRDREISLARAINGSTP